MPRPTRTAALISAVALTVAACGGSTKDTEPASAAAAGPATVAGPATAASPLPAVAVLDVASGERVQLAGYLPAAKPTLVWMWAPH